MNNFPAVTEAQRQVLIGRLQIYIRTAETAIKAGLATKEDVFNLTVWKIALAALTAEASEYRDIVGASIGKAEALELQAEGYFLRKLYDVPPAPVLRVQELTVWYGAMPETNGKSNWTAILHRKGECISTGITIDRSEYPERVRYEADRMRYLIGELLEEPDILAYDANKHSGYKKPAPPEASNEQ